MKSSQSLLKQMLAAATILSGFAIVGTALVGVTFETTKDKIADNEREYLLRSLHELVPKDSHDNDIYADHIRVNNREWLGAKKPVSIFRARLAGEPVAAVIAAQAPDGYNGTIKLLVAIKQNGELSGVRVIGHKETPGLVDAIEASRSNWILQFDGKSLSKPQENHWAVKKDGGEFDQLTGATITPRAIVKATHKALKYFAANKQQLFKQPSSQHEPQHAR